MRIFSTHFSMKWDSWMKTQNILNSRYSQNLKLEISRPNIQWNVYIFEWIISKTQSQTRPIYLDFKFVGTLFYFILFLFEIYLLCKSSFVSTHLLLYFFFFERFCAKFLEYWKCEKRIVSRSNKCDENQNKILGFFFCYSWIFWPTHWKSLEWCWFVYFLLFFLALNHSLYHIMLKAFQQFHKYQTQTYKLHMYD